MCLIVLAWQIDPAFDLLLAANRDEFHARPTEPAHWWRTPEGLFAGRDRQAGGAWCGADRQGRFAAVTNVREPAAPAGPRSRGALVRDYFAQNGSAADWAEYVAATGAEYAPFNLLVGDRERLYFVSNRDTAGPRRVEPGILAVSNGHWGEHWPKTERARHKLQTCIAEADRSADSLLALLWDAEPAPPEALPDTGIPQAHEHFLSPMFIRGERYGTRASTVIRRRRVRDLQFDECGFDQTGEPVHRIQQHWSLEPCST